jgi:hypothetical protein
MFPLPEALRRKKKKESSDDGEDEEKNGKSETQGEDEEEDDEEEYNGYEIPLPKLQVTHDGHLEEKLLVRTEGWMYKKGGAVNQRIGRKNWKRRWFVLTQFDFRGQTGYELQYFDRPNGALKGSVGLMDVVIFCEARTKHRKIKYEFQLNLPNGGTLELSCDEPEEREQWIETLNMVIAFMRTLTHPAAMVLNGYDPLEEEDEEIFEMGERIAQNCQAYGPGLYGAEAGTREQFVLQIYDVDGVQVARGGMPVTCSISNEHSLYYVKVHDNQDGTFSAYYMLGAPGHYKLSIRLNDEHEIHGSPFDIEILPSRTVGSSSTAEGEALSFVYPDVPSTFTIVARDGLGNAKTRGGDPFEVSVLGPAHLDSVDDNEDGTYTCTFEAQDPSRAQFFAANTLQIAISLYGKPIVGSPFRPVILDAPAPSGFSSHALLAQRQQQQEEEEREAAEEAEEDERRRRLFFGGGEDEAEAAAAAAAAAAAEEEEEEEAHDEFPEQQIPSPTPPRRVSAVSSDDRSGTSQDRIARARERAARKKRMESGEEPSTPMADAPPSASRTGMGAASVVGGSVGAGSKVSAAASLLSPADVATLREELQRGLVGAVPAGSSDDERLTWALLSRALSSPAVVDQIMSSVAPLKQGFDLLTDVVEGVRVIKPAGAKRILSELGVVPQHCTEREVQLVYSLMLVAQSACSAPAAALLGGSVLDFAHHVRFLVGLALLVLTKNPAANAEYSSLEVRPSPPPLSLSLSSPLLSSPLLLLILTLSLFLSLFLPQAKVAVLLKTWGLGERTKMGLLRAKVKGARR